MNSLAMHPAGAEAPPWLLQLWGFLCPLLSDNEELGASELTNPADFMA